MTHAKLHQARRNWLYFSLQALHLLSYFASARQITFAKQRFLVIQERFRLAENLRSACYLPSVFSYVLAARKTTHLTTACTRENKRAARMLRARRARVNRPFARSETSKTKELIPVQSDFP